MSIQSTGASRDERRGRLIGTKRKVAAFLDISINTLDRRIAAGIGPPLIKTGERTQGNFEEILREYASDYSQAGNP